MRTEISNVLIPIGRVQSTLKEISDAPNQGYQGAPAAWVHISGEYLEALDGVSVGDEIILFTWFHLADRAVLKVHPQNNKRNPLTGVFATRSPDRPNPLGIHPVKVLQIMDNKIKVGPLEAIDGTPVVDIKPVI